MKLNPAASLGPVRLPRDIYKLRIVKEPEYKVSAQGNRMLVFDQEVISPVTTEVDGVTRTVAGQKIRTHCVIEQDKTFMYEALCKDLGLPAIGVQDFDDNTGLPSGISFTGREVNAVCESKITEQLNEKREKLISPTTGEPLTSFQHEVKKYNP